jgi:hypothetical protein
MSSSAAGDDSVTFPIKSKPEVGRRNMAAAMASAKMAAAAAGSGLLILLTDEATTVSAERRLSADILSGEIDSNNDE